MRRYGMLLLVLVLAVTSLLAAAAYNVATVTNAATIKVSTTDDSLLSLTPQVGTAAGNTYGWHSAYLNVGNKDGTARIDNGVLVLDFSRGAGGYSTAGTYATPGGGNHGVQPNSVYIWDNLFMIRNKTAELLTVELSADLNLPDGVDVYMKAHESGTWVLVSGGLAVVKDLDARNGGDSDELYVDVKIEVASGVTDWNVFQGTVVVKATAY